MLQLHLLPTVAQIQCREFCCDIMKPKPYEENHEIPL